MSYIEEDNDNVKTMMNMFAAIGKLSKYYSIGQAVDVLDVYFKTGDESYITNEDNIRDFVVKSNVVDKFQSIYEEGYNHLSDYIDEICPKKGKTK